MNEQKNFSRIKTEAAEAAITGIGIISPIGCNPDAVLHSLRSKKDGIRKATKIDTSKFLSQLCGEVADFDCSSNMTPEELDTFSDPYIRLALNAARMAAKDAGLAAFPEKTAMVLATCNGGLNSGEAEYVREYINPNAVFDVSTLAQYEYYALCKVAANAMKIGGECWMVNTACSGSTAAIGLAESLIGSGKADCVLVGGADAVALSNFAGFNAIKVLSPEKIAPFSMPVGMNIGEGAAFWILESRKHAESRGAKIYGKVIGHATTGDAHHPTQPDPRGDGAFRTMRNAAANAGVSVEQIGCINAHGSGTAANDKAESKGITKFLAGTAVPATSTKSYTGHCMGATGIIEATCQLLSMNDGFIPPTLRYSGPRPGCETEVASGDGIEKKYDCFLSANYAFAGNNAAIIVAKDAFSDYDRPHSRTDIRPAISGCSAISPLGINMEENLAALLKGASGISKITRFPSDRSAGMVSIPNLRSLDRRIDFGGMNLISTYATIAAKGALDSALLQVRRSNCEDVGLAVSTCRGSSESAHMEAVFSTADMRGDIGCFSNSTANSTAGWVSKALEIKGANITLTSGPNSGLQTIGYAARLIREGAAKSVVAVAADELYKREMDAYEKFGLLHEGKNEENFRLDYSSYGKSVLGEGAAAAVVEDISEAKLRGAKILGEILAYSSASSMCGFNEPNLECGALLRASENALSEAGVSTKDIELILWSPRGCAQDSTAIFARDKMFPGTPMVATSLNTGYLETASSMHVLACALSALADGKTLWCQKTGVRALDATPLPGNPKLILCLASSNAGNNYALLVGIDTI